MFPLWATELVSYWLLFALMVLSIERATRDIKWDMLKGNEAISGHYITAISFLGMALLILWVFFH